MLHLIDHAAFIKYVAAGDRVLLAVSGGADSICMLHVMHDLAQSGKLPVVLHVGHVNHLLRGQQAAEDAEFVRGTCEHLDVPFHYAEIQPPDQRAQGVTLEEHLRNERRRCLKRIAREHGIPTIALAHTRNDLVENFLMHLLRGSGLHGLTFRFAVALEELQIVRPLWQTGRTAIVEYLRQRNIQWREDPTNESTDITRNRIRHVLLPLIEREFNPAAVETIFRASQALTQVHDFLSQQAVEALKLSMPKDDDSNEPPVMGASLDIPQLRQHPAAVQHEALRLWLNAHGCTPGNSQIMAIIQMIEVSGKHEATLTGSLRLVRSGDFLVLIKGSGEDTTSLPEIALACSSWNSDAPLASVPPVQVDLSSGSAETELHLLDGSAWRARVCAASAQAPNHVWLRNRLPGDRLAGGKKLKEALIDHKVPQAVRDYLIVAADSPTAGTIHTIAGLPSLAGTLIHPIVITEQRIEGSN